MEKNRMQVKSAKGEIINIDLGTKLGSGGEANIYAIEEDGALCVKIYKTKQKTSQILSKIEEMISIYLTIRQNKGEAEQFFDNNLAWPRLKVYYLDSNEFAGFVMNKLPLNQAVKLDDFFNADLRGTKSWKNRIDIAINLLRTLKFLHSNDIVAGDLHGGNIFVLPNSEVAIIDCDSFQIGNKFRVSALQPEIAPPDAKYVEYFEASFDIFTVTILIYRLLMDGFNPFQFRREGPFDPDLEQNKAAGFAPIRDPTLQLPPKSPPLSRLPDALRKALANALAPDPNIRPSIDKLISALKETKRTGKTPVIPVKPTPRANKPPIFSRTSSTPSPATTASPQTQKTQTIPSKSWPASVGKPPGESRFARKFISTVAVTGLILLVIILIRKEKSQPPPQAQFVFRAAEDNRINVRTEPSEYADVLAVINVRKGEPISVFQTEGEWYKIGVTVAKDKIRYGWIHTNLVESSGPIGKKPPTSQDSVKPPIEEPPIKYEETRKDVMVPSKMEQVDAGIYVKQGDTLIFEAESKIQWDENEEPVGPEGASYKAGTLALPEEFLSPGYPCGCLLGKVGESGSWFHIGSSKKMVASDNGNLYLGVNDRRGRFDDNRGSFGVGIRKKRKISP
jgi:serine/threonine protein kinase